MHARHLRFPVPVDPQEPFDPPAPSLTTSRIIIVSSFSMPSADTAIWSSCGDAICQSCTCPKKQYVEQPKIRGEGLAMRLAGACLAGNAQISAMLGQISGCLS